MSSVHSDPIREILNQTRGKDCSMVDLLIQSISLCIGFYFLDEGAIRSLQSGAILQKDFENIVDEHLQKTKPKTAASFRAFSQVRLLEDTFQQLFLYWAQFSKDKNKLRRLVERLIYPNLIRYYRADLMVPTWLERFAVDLLPIADGIFYDGTAGAGGVAIGLAKYGQEKECDIQVFTKEIDPLLFHLSILRSQMHGLEFRQANEDCIQDSQLLAKGKANMSIMFPPLRGGEPIQVTDTIVCGSDWSYAFHQLEMLSETGVGVCRIPNGALFNAKNMDFRKYLLEMNVIDTIIALPKNAVSFSTMPATSLIVFRKGRKRDDVVQMVELPLSGQPEQKNGLDSINYNSRKSILPIMQEKGFSVYPSELDAFNLSPQKYSYHLRRQGSGQQVYSYTSEQKAAIDLPSRTVPLQDVAKIYRGINVAGFSLYSEGTEVLRLSDVQNSQICMDRIIRYDLSKRENLERYQIKAGDILISCKGKAVKLCVVSKDMPVILSHDFLGIRTDDTKINRWYLFYYLQSPAGQRAIQQIQMGSSIPMIRAVDLEHLPIYYIPLAQQIQYAEELHRVNTHVDEQLMALQGLRQRAYKQYYQKIGLGETL